MPAFKRHLPSPTPSTASSTSTPSDIDVAKASIIAGVVLIVAFTFIAVIRRLFFVCSRTRTQEYSRAEGFLQKLRLLTGASKSRHVSSPAPVQSAPNHESIPPLSNLIQVQSGLPSPDRPQVHRAMTLTAPSTVSISRVDPVPPYTARAADEELALPSFPPPTFSPSTSRAQVATFTYSAA